MKLPILPSEGFRTPMLSVKYSPVSDSVQERVQAIFSGKPGLTLQVQLSGSGSGV